MTSSRSVCTRASGWVNGCRAWGEYHSSPHGGPLHCTGVITADCTTEDISEMTHFESGTATSFGLPRALPAVG